MKFGSYHLKVLLVQEKAAGSSEVSHERDLSGYAKPEFQKKLKSSKYFTEPGGRAQLALVDFFILNTQCLQILEALYAEWWNESPRFSSLPQQVNENI